MALITDFWGDPEAGEQVKYITAAFIDRVISAAEDEGLAQSFVYEKYAAASFQDPLQSTGNPDFFREVALKYDPVQMFQRLVVGRWKLY